jgi:hypothetical protein
MTISNRFTFDQLREAMAVSNGVNAEPLKLTPPHFIDLQDELADRAESLKLDKALLDRLMGEQFSKTATDQYAAAKKDAGKVTTPLDDANELVMDRKKTVDWDQDALAAIAAKIKAADEDPAIYIITKPAEMTVKEASFDSWPDEVKEAFLPARTVKVADTKFLVQPKKKAK